VLTKNLPELKIYLPFQIGSNGILKLKKAARKVTTTVLERVYEGFGFYVFPDKVSISLMPSKQLFLYLI
jgi:hypothetical protein